MSATALVCFLFSSMYLTRASSLLLYSESTLYLQVQLSKVFGTDSGYTHLTLNSTTALEAELVSLQPERIFDLTQSSLLSLELQVYVSKVTPIFVLKDTRLVQTRTEDLGSKSEAQALISLLQEFGWERFSLLRTTDAFSQDVAFRLQEQFLEANVFTVSIHATLSQLLSFVGRFIKPEGRMFFVLLTPTSLTAMLLQAFKAKKLYRTGNLFILGSMNDQMSLDLLLSLGGGLLTFSQVNQVPNSFVDRLILLISSSGNAAESRQLFNEVNSTYSYVGTCSSGLCSMTGILTFPGPTSSLPVNSKASVVMSLPTQYTDSNEYVAYIHVLGAVAAIEDINKGNAILPGFRFENQTYYFGLLNWMSEDAYSNALKLKFEFGSALASGIDTESVLDLFGMFAQANVTVPIIGSENSYYGFSNSTFLPFFVRTTVSDSYSAQAYSQFLQVFGWKKCALFYEPGLSLSGFVSDFLAHANTTGIEITNPLDHRQFPSNFANLTIDATLYMFQEIVQARTRVVVIVSSTRDIVYKSVLSLYYAGARKGDVVVFSAFWLVNNIWEYMRGPDYAQFLEIMPGAIIAYPMTYIGKIGKTLYSRFQQEYQIDPPAGMCLYYDTAMLVGYALDFLINTGEDPENPGKVMSAIRSTKFVGCSGAVAIDSSSNDRSQMDFVVQNLKYYQENDTWSLDSVLQYSPTSSVVLTNLEPFQWPDGTTSTPLDTVVFDINCPFPSRDLEVSQPGRIIMMVVCYSLIVATAVVTLYIWKKWRNVSIPALTERCEISTSDIMVLVSILVEFAQYCAMAPDNWGVMTIFSTVSEHFTLSLDNFVEMQNGVFWLVLDGVFGACASWTVFLVMYRFDLWRHIKHICMMQTLEEIADLGMPLLGDLCFLPIISTLLEVFLCDQATVTGLEASILHKDCYQHCWVYPHYLYVVGAVVFLVVYVPTATFCRPLWQEFEANLHVRTLPLYLMLKTVFQVTLIVLNKTVKRIWPLPHSLVFTCVLLFFAGLTIKKKPFNYSRPNLWQVILLLGVTWLGIVTSVINLMSQYEGILAYFLLGGWITLVMIGFIVQVRLCPSLLYRKKGKDIGNLFRFQLSRSGIDPKSISPSLNKVRQTIEPQDTAFF